MPIPQQKGKLDRHRREPCGDGPIGLVRRLSGLGLSVDHMKLGCRIELALPSWPRRMSFQIALGACGVAGCPRSNCRNGEQRRCQTPDAKPGSRHEYIPRAEGDLELTNKTTRQFRPLDLLPRFSV
jgi:hypothetical protein